MNSLITLLQFLSYKKKIVWLMMYVIISIFYLKVLEKINMGVLGFGFFIIDYFGVVFDLEFQIFPVRTHFQRCGNFYVTVLSNCVCRMCTFSLPKIMQSAW